MPGLDAIPGRAAVGQAPGKVILVGEHAVVYGEPAIALPLHAAGVTATATPAPGPLTLAGLGWQGPLESAPEALRGLGALVDAALAGLGAPASGLALTLESTLPIGRGLGSSASAAVALVRAIYAAHGAEVPESTLLELVNVAERHAHGTPSGLDATVIAMGVPVWFRRGEPAERLGVGGPLHLVVADSGRPRDTRRAVASVREGLLTRADDTERAIAALGDLASGSRAAMAVGDAVALGAYMDMAQRALETLGVSSPSLDRLIRAARQAEAMGAKLTGAGQGGCMLALAGDSAHQAQLRQALLDAGAPQAWALTLERDPA
jgi:mevalonate kinase